MPNLTDPSTQVGAIGLYFYFNETTGDLVYSDKATYSGDGYTSLGQQTNTSPSSPSNWIFDSLRDNIKTVTKDSSISSKISVLTSMLSMFNSCGSLISADLSGFDTSNVTSMSYMFKECGNIKSIDLSNFNTSNVTSMMYMFDRCYVLSSIKGLNNFNTSNVTNMSYMFRNCDSFNSIDVSNFDTSNVTNMRYMFFSCGQVISINLDNFDTSKVTDVSHMFDGCGYLKALNLSNFNTLNATSRSNMLSDCTNLRVIDISPNMSNTLSSLPADTYYDAVTRRPYSKAAIPGGSTYVRDLDDLDLVATMVQTRIGINKVKGMLNESGKKISDLTSIVNTVSNQISIIEKRIDVKSVSIESDPWSILSSSLFHETVKLSVNERISSFIRILGSIRLSTPNTLYVPYFGVKILLDVNKPDDDPTDLRCSGVISALTSTGECVSTGTYCGNISTNILYCSMVTVDRDLQGSKGITTLLFQ